MSYRMTEFNMQEEFVGSHIDENGFLSFTKPKEQKKRTKEDAIYGIWNEQVEESVFKGSKQLAKTTLGMNFRKSGQIQHESDTGIKIKQAVSKAKEDNSIEKSNEQQSGQKKQKRKVRFDENNLTDNQLKTKQLKEELKKKKLKDDDSEEEEVSDQEYEDENPEDQSQDSSNDEGDDDDTIGFGRQNKNKMFFKSSNKKQKGILKKQKLEKDILEDLDDLDSNDEDEDINQSEDKVKKTSWLGESMQLTKEQLRKKRIFDFKKGKEDDEENTLEEQSKQFGLPVNFGRQRKLQKREEERETEEIVSQNKFKINGNDEKSQQEKEHSDFYGKGFKMLAKMGYKVGQGIGKYEQGIAKPVEAVHKQNFSMQDNYKEMEKANKKLLKDEFGIDVEEELDQFDKKLNNGKSNQEDDEEIGDIHIERTYVKAEEGKKKQFSNRYFSYLDGKSKRAQAGNNKIKPNEEGVEQNRERQTADGMTKIVDMRGETAVSYEKSKGGYAAIFGVNKSLSDSKNLLKGESPIFGEMLLNLKNKLDKSKSKVMHLTSKLKTEEDRIVNFEYESKQISQAALKNSKTTEQVVQLLKKLKEIQLNKSIISSEQSVLDLFEELFKSNELQFVKFNMEQLAVKTLEEILSKNESTNGNGNYNKNNNEGFFEAKIGNASQDVATLQRLETFLKTVFLWRQNESLRAYESELQSNIHLTRETVISEQNARIIQRYVHFVCNKSFIQPLNSYLMKSFTPTDLKANHNLIDCLECYQNILPSSSISDIIQTLILPRLSESVKKWQPYNKKNSTLLDKDNTTTASIQIDPDMWLLPWMTVITPIELLKDTFKLILAKFSQALQKWEVEDTTMLSRIKPWQKIVSPQQWNDLMVKQIVPKLQYAFDEIVVNPSEQLGLEIIQNVIAWCELLQDSDICNIMEENLLAKLQEVLVEWIDSDGADSSHIVAWLKGWKTLLGSRVMSIPLITQQFNSFLEKAERM